MFDLNVPWPQGDYTKPTPQQLVVLKNVIATLYVLGYTNIAINFNVKENVRLPYGQPHTINPIPIAELRTHFGHFANLRLFLRVTLQISDPAQCQGLAKIQNIFDIIAIQPCTEKALQLATTNLDIDLISLNLSNRLPFFLKHKTIGAAVEKGIKFEVCYSLVILGPAGYLVASANDNMSLLTTALLARKVFFSNVMQLIRALRSRGLVLLSAALQPLQVRNGPDVLNLLKTVGLDNARAKACLYDNPERVLVSGRLRIKSFKQTIMVDDRLLFANDKEEVTKKTDATPYKKKLEDTSSGRLLKRQRT
jgi:ribonuclease P/MRP protein subunit RPP1